MLSLPETYRGTAPDQRGFGGLANPEFLRLVKAGVTSLDNAFSPRAVLRMLIYKLPFIPVCEDDLVAATLQTHIGPKYLPGDSIESPNWPFRAPSLWGIANAASPKYAGDLESLYRIEPKPPVLWLRGSHDLVVSDRLPVWGHWEIPSWPGAEIFPPQPMLG